MRKSISGDYDVVVVGGSIAGCTAAILLAREGASVALLERKPDPQSFKRMCSHYIQSSAIATLERLGVLDPIEVAGGVRSGLRIWTVPTSVARRDPDPSSGWLHLSAGSKLPLGVNIRRERLDPLLREFAGKTAGVDVMIGKRVNGLLRLGGRFAGVECADGTRLRARMVVGADGRDSSVAELAGVSSRRFPSVRFTYSGYYDGPAPSWAPDTALWFLDPQFGAALPTDSGLMVYLCMPTNDRLPEFRRDPDRALTKFMSELPDPPPILESERVGKLIGKLDMPNFLRSPIAPGLTLTGDAALTTDPLWGIGCGWAFQSGEWLADCLGPGLRGEEPIERCQRRYRRRLLRRLAPHAAMINDYSTGRPLSFFERLLFTSAGLDQRVAHQMEAFSTRTVGPHHLMAPATLLRAATASLRRRLSQGPPYPKVEIPRASPNGRLLVEGDGHRPAATIGSQS